MRPANATRPKRTPGRPNATAPPAPGSIRRRLLQTSAQPQVDESTRTVELSFSSESPVDMGYCVEVLSHDPDAVDLDRLNNGAPLLFNHDMDDVLGVVESASVGPDRKGRAVVRLGRDDRGTWAMQQIADGVLRNVSVTYVIDACQQDLDDDESIVVTRWTPVEISLVSVPADPSVGVGRAFNFTPRKINMDNDDDLALEGQQTSRRTRAATNRAAEDERERVLSIQNMCRRFNAPDLERHLIDSGTTVQEARRQVYQRQPANMQRPVASPGFGSDYGDPGRGELGLSDTEVGAFSIVRAINAMLTNDWSRAGLERSASRAMETRFGRSSQGLFVPPEVMARTPWSQRASYSTGGGSGVTGASIVPTTLAADSFIDVLRNEAMVTQAGATMLGGLVGNLDLPRQISQSTGYWVAESGAITESEATFDKLSLKPKTIGALSKMSRLMLLQSTPAIELLARSDLMQVLALGVDLAALSGSGASNQPTGIVNTVGLSPTILGTNGANVTLDVLNALETVLNSGNAPMAGRAYMLNPQTVATLKNLKSTTGQYLWTNDPPGQRSATPHSFNGYPVFVTNQVRHTLTKGSSSGVCSELFLGCWSDLVIASWGTLEILVNPYESTGFANGDVIVRAMQTVDIGVRRPASFAYCGDALTP